MEGQDYKQGKEEYVAPIFQVKSACFKKHRKKDNSLKTQGSI